jgi:hypothetical protein
MRIGLAAGVNQRKKSLMWRAPVDYLSTGARKARQPALHCEWSTLYYSLLNSGTRPNPVSVAGFDAKRSERLSDIARAQPARPKALHSQWSVSAISPHGPALLDESSATPRLRPGRGWRKERYIFRPIRVSSILRDRGRNLAYTVETTARIRSHAAGLNVTTDASAELGCLDIQQGAILGVDRTRFSSAALELERAQ